jgi:hypothetical protein
MIASAQSSAWELQRRIDILGLYICGLYNAGLALQRPQAASLLVYAALYVDGALLCKAQVRLFHITTRSSWDEAVAMGAYSAPPLATDDFIPTAAATTCPDDMKRPAPVSRSLKTAHRDRLDRFYQRVDNVATCRSTLSAARTNATSSAR